MPGFFTLATEATKDLCQQLIEKFHIDLDSSGVKVDIVMAFRDPDGEEPAMKKDGHRILGKASLIGLKDRVKGMGDCEILLDGDAWDNFTPELKAAILDHELEHFEAKRDKKGEFVYDDLSRITLKIRAHDRQFGWFDSIAQRHRANSMEIQQLQKLFTEGGATYLPHVQKFAGVEGEPPIDLEDKATVTVSTEGTAVTVPLKDLKTALQRKQEGGAA